jgi:hypothetical protein
MALKQHCLTQVDTPWNPSPFSYQVHDKFYNQVVDTESNNANKFKLFPYDPSNTHKNSMFGKPSIHIFSRNNVMKAQVDHARLTNREPYHNKTLPIKVDYEMLLPYFAVRPHDVIQNALWQNVQLAPLPFKVPINTDPPYGKAIPSKST